MFNIIFWARIKTKYSIQMNNTSVIVFLVFLKSNVTPSMYDIRQSTELHRRENVVNFASRMQWNLRNILLLIKQQFS